MANFEETERDVIAQAVKEELARILAEQNKGQETKTEAKPEPIVLNLNGQKYSFDNTEALEKTLAKTFQDFQVALSLKQEPAAKEGSYVTGKDGEQFTQDKFIDLMSKNALDAQNYALNHAIFGGKVPNAAEVLRQTVENAANTQAALSIYQFRDRHPEFALNNETGATLDNLRKELGQPLNLVGLEAAYGVGVARGIIKPQATKTATETRQETVQAPPAQQRTQTAQYFDPDLAPPPTVKRSADPQFNDLISQAENMSLDQLKAVFDKVAKLG